jgi:uncharacterized protein YigE (DUF2233 family)
MVSPISALVVDPQKYAIEVHWKGSDGAVLGSLSKLREYIKNSNREGRERTLIMGMNAGMYLQSPKGHPMGLLVVDGQPGCCKNGDHGILKLNKGNSRSANFYVKPNGVFYVTKSGKAGVCLSGDFNKIKGVRWATQSGPILVLNGKINSNKTLSPTSRSKYIRNGVGIRKDGHVVFAISNRPVNFYEFALFMQQKGCHHALYFDGGVSSMYCPRLGRLGLGRNLGPMVAVIQ